MFAKVFSQIFDSSIAEDHTTRHIFMDLLVLADSDGVVDMTPHAISRRINVPLPVVSAALERLSSPDPSSRSPGEEGRRIVLIDSHRDWGWQIVNYDHYRKTQDEEARRKYFRDYRQEKRAEAKAKVQPEKQNVQRVQPCSTEFTHAEGEGDAEGEASKTGKNGKNGSSNLPTSEPAIRISNLFSRRLTTAWSHKEIQTFKAIGKIESDDLSLIEAYYAAERARGDDGCHRRDLQTFLNNFNGELDRARGWKLKTAPKNSSVTKPAMPDYPDGFKDFMDAKQTKHKPFSQWHVGFQQEFIHSEFNKSKR